MNIKSLLEKINKLKSEILYKYFKIEQIQDLLMKLSERDRKIVLSIACVAAAILILGVYSGISHSLTRWDQNIQKKIKNFDQIRALGNEYRVSQDTLRRIENTIKRTPPDFSIASHLEDLAQKNGIKIDSMKPKPVTPNDYFKETQVELKIHGVSLKTLVNYLFQIENSQEFLKITAIQIRPSYSKPMFLDITFSVSTFSKA
jgi:type II secretory pathway component PulM